MRSQRQGDIKLIAKTIKNWKPISLFNTYYKTI